MLRICSQWTVQLLYSMKSAASLIVKINKVKIDQCKFAYESTSADYVEYMCCGKRETHKKWRLTWSLILTCFWCQNKLFHHTADNLFRIFTTLSASGKNSPQPVRRKYFAKFSWYCSIHSNTTNTTASYLTSTDGFHTSKSLLTIYLQE